MQRKAASFLLTLLLLVGPRQAEAQYRQLHFEGVTAPLIVMPDEGGALNLLSVAADDGERGGVDFAEGERSLWRYPLIGAGVGAVVVLITFMVPASPFYAGGAFDDGMGQIVLGAYVPLGALLGGLIGVGMNTAQAQ